MINVQLVGGGSLGQGVPFPQAFERAQQALPILRGIAAELRQTAGPQRLLTFSDFGTPEGPADWTASERTLFVQNRDALVAAIREVNPAVTELSLRRQNAFPMVPPEVPPEPINVDTLTGQLDKLIAIYEETVLGKKPIVKASPALIIVGLLVGLLGFAALVHFAGKES